MTPQEAKTKIENLLNLGILYGVKVESSKGEITRCYKIDFEPALPDHIWYTGKRVIDRAPYPEMFSFTTNPNDIPPFLRDVAAIHPIPLEPKVLEAGTRVKIIDGQYKNSIGIIRYINSGICTVHLISGEFSANDVLVVIYNVVPESLLVEEEEIEPIITIPESKILFDGNYLLSDVEEALKQAGYKLTKE